MSDLDYVLGCKQDTLAIICDGVMPTLATASLQQCLKFFIAMPTTQIDIYISYRELEPNVYLNISRNVFGKSIWEKSMDGL